MSGVLQGADDLLAAVERFEKEPDVFPIGTRVRHEDGRLGRIETRREDQGLWPVGVRFDSGRYESCALTELRVERSAVIA